MRAAHARCDPARGAVVGGGRAQTHATGYVYAPLPRPAATCARTPRWLISSQISLLDCGAARWSMPAALPFFPPSRTTYPISLVLSLSLAPLSAPFSPLSLSRGLHGQCRLPRRRPPWSYTGYPEHYCYTVVHCQRRKMETRGRDIINDRRSRPKPEPARALIPCLFRSPSSHSTFPLPRFFFFLSFVLFLSPSGNEIELLAVVRRLEFRRPEYVSGNSAQIRRPI